MMVEPLFQTFTELEQALVLVSRTVEPSSRVLTSQQQRLYSMRQDRLRYARQMVSRKLLPPPKPIIVTASTTESSSATITPAPVVAAADVSAAVSHVQTVQRERIRQRRECNPKHENKIHIVCIGCGAFNVKVKKQKHPMDTKYPCTLTNALMHGLFCVRASSQGIFW